MSITLNWKKGLLWAAGTVVAGFALFMLVFSPIDTTCRASSSGAGGCRVFNGLSTVVQGYTDFWRQFIAPQCLGGGGPDDCLGPDFGIMFWTLAFAGFAVGGTSKRKTSSEVQT